MRKLLLLPLLCCTGCFFGGPEKGKNKDKDVPMPAPVAPAPALDVKKQ